MTANVRTSGVGFALVFVVVLTSLAGCKSEPRMGAVTCPASQPVSGFICPLTVESPPPGVAFEWDFGDGTRRKDGPETTHAWAKPGDHRIRATAPGVGFWEGTVLVTPPGDPVDLRGLLGCAPDGPSRILVYRLEDQQYTSVSDPSVVSALGQLLSQAQPAVCATWPSSGFELHLLDADGLYLGKVHYSRGVVTVTRGGAPRPSEPYLLAADPTPQVEQLGGWRGGVVENGVAREPPGELPYAFLPSACLSAEVGDPVPGNVVETYGLEARGTLTLEDAKNVLVRLSGESASEDFGYILGLLASAAAADPTDVAAYPAEWHSLPNILICVRGQGLDIDIGFVSGLGCFWARDATGDAPEHVYVMTPQLERFLEGLTSLGEG